jgi:hypothetical protein
MSSKAKKQEALPAVTEHVTKFEVDPGGALSIANYKEANTRAELYEDVVSYWSDPLGLSEAMTNCEPLAWAVHSIYSEIRSELEADVVAAQKGHSKNRKRRTALQARLRSMPQEPTVGVQPWLLTLTSREFDAWISPEIEKWFEKEPDWVFEDDYLPKTATAQGAALEFFLSMDRDQLEMLGVQVIEGDFPGSSYYAAELGVDISKANRAAKKAGIPVRFIAAKS